MKNNHSTGLTQRADQKRNNWWTWRKPLEMSWAIVCLKRRPQVDVFYIGPPCPTFHHTSVLQDYCQRFWVGLMCMSFFLHAVLRSSLHGMDYWSRRLWLFLVQPSRDLFWCNVDLRSLSGWCFSPRSADGSTLGHTHSCGANHTSEALCQDDRPWR